MNNHQLLAENQHLRDENRKMEDKLGRLQWIHWELLIALTKFTGNIEDLSAIPELFREALLNTRVADQIDILYPLEDFYQTNFASGPSFRLKSDILNFIPFADEPEQVKREQILEPTSRWEEFSICWAIRLRERERVTRAIAFIWRENPVSEPEMVLIRTLASISRLLYSFQASGAKSAWQRISRDHAELLGVPLECANTIVEQFSSNGKKEIHLHSEKAQRLRSYLEDLDRAKTRALVLSDAFSERLESIEIDKIVRMAREELPEQISGKVKCQRLLNRKVALMVPLFKFALQDLILILWKYGNGKNGIIIECSEYNRAVILDLSSEGKGLPDDVKQEVLSGNAVFHPRGNYYGQGILSLRACKKIIDELHSNGECIGKLSEVGNENRMHFRITMGF